MSKIILVFLVLFFSIPAVAPSCHASFNLAMGKPYTVSPKPNYPLTASATDATSLTDGKHTIGYFWAQKTTVGWMGVKDVEILIDLEKVSTIGAISFSTAQGTGGGVYYPVHIFAFVGPDKEHLLYVGDIIGILQNKPVLYETKRFLLDGIGTKGRYVLLEIRAPKSGTVFCDEIEVLEGNQDKGKAGNLTIEKTRSLTEQMNRSDTEKKLLNGIMEKFGSTVAVHPESAGRLAKIKQGIITLQSIKDSETIEADILKLRGERLNAEFPGKHLLLEAVNPWTPLSPVASPTGVPLQDLFLTLPVGGHGHVAFMITNLSSDSQKISLSLAKQQAGAPDLALYQVPFVKSATIEYVADPLVPIEGGFMLRPGESRMVFVTAFGRTPGVWKSLVKVAVGGTVTSIPVKIQDLKVNFTKNFTLNAVNWGYLDSAPIKDRKVEAVNDLFSHHTNVIAVPPAYLPLADPEKPLDFSRLEDYLSLYRGTASKVMFGMGYGRAVSRLTVGGRYVYMDEKWKAGFLKWYKEALKAAAKAGFVEDQVYLYPYDEMSGGDIDQFIELAQWAKKEIPSIKFYATLNNIQSLKVLPYLDIAQIIDRISTPAEAKSAKTELWLYNANGPGKSLSPYSYYRMMSWKAFYLSFKGIGFWAYADTNSSDNAGAWDDFKHKNTNYVVANYAVIYPGNGNTIVSSRRWEAWRMGIEDYELLTMYSKAKGDAAAKSLAKSVLDNPLDTTKADEVRRKILVELSK